MILFLGLFLACKDSEQCFTPPQPVIFEFVDEDGNNMISNGLLHANNFEFREYLGNMESRLVTYQISDDDRIQLDEAGWTAGVKQYEFLSIFNSFLIVVSAQENDGCGGTHIEDVAVSEVEHEERNGYIQVTLDLL